MQSTDSPSDGTDAIFARRVKEVRDQAGMTQQQLADVMAHAMGNKQIHRSTIGKIESGDRVVSVGEALHLSVALGVPLAELLIDVNADSEQERAHRARVEQQVRVRALQHETAERYKLAEEAIALRDNSAARLQAEQRRLREMGGELPWDTPGVPPGAGLEIFGPPEFPRLAGPSRRMEDLLAEQSRPLEPGED